jgi:hypothetical protein
MAKSVRRDREFQWNEERPSGWIEKSPALIADHFYYVWVGYPLQKVIQHNPLIVLDEKLPCLIESVTTIDNRIVSSKESDMKLSGDDVFVVS